MEEKSSIHSSLAFIPREQPGPLKQPHLLSKQVESCLHMNEKDNSFGNHGPEVLNVKVETCETNNKIVKILRLNLLIVRQRILRKMTEISIIFTNNY